MADQYRKSHLRLELKQREQQGWLMGQANSTAACLQRVLLSPQQVLLAKQERAEAAAVAAVSAQFDLIDNPPAVL